MDISPGGRSVAISTWLTLDGSADATTFPSAGQDSSERSFQDIYWRCIAIYYLSARIHNPTAPLLFFCNEDFGRFAPRGVADLLVALDVVTVKLDLSHRLPKGSVSQWGNVFYELDILLWFSQNETFDGLVITDSDCVWRSPFRPFEPRLMDTSCLIYTLDANDQKNYEGNVLINGMSRSEMQAVLFKVFEKQVSSIQHNGGEFLAVTRDFCVQNAGNVERLWEFAVSSAWAEDSIKTEEHFWNIIAKLNDIPELSANDIVRRMWTNFEDRNVTPEDLKLPLWHLPSEKRYGFRRMWDWFAASERPWTDITPAELNAALEYFMGIPKRSPKKMFLDVAEKLTERISR